MQRQLGVVLQSGGVFIASVPDGRLRVSVGVKFFNNVYMSILDTLPSFFIIFRVSPSVDASG